jgi:NDP-sugar pyrophosphorylase family protein
MSKRAIILAGGMGTRLRPYTTVLPKPLMPIGDYPILEVVVRQLVHYGFDHITLAVNHQSALIRAFFGDGKNWGVHIDYSQENEPLGTIGPLSLINDLPPHFLIMNGDVLTDLNFANFYDKHVKANQIFSISSYQRMQKIDYGVLVSNANGMLSGFQEKPCTNYQVSMGIYMASSSITKYISRTPYGFDNLMLDLLAGKHDIRVEPFNGYWLDIGRPDDYMQAIDEFEKKKKMFLCS